MNILQTTTCSRKAVLLLVPLVLLFLLAGCAKPATDIFTVAQNGRATESNDPEPLIQEREYEKALVALLEEDASILHRQAAIHRLSAINERVMTAQRYLQNSITALSKGDLEEARKEVTEGLKVYPHHQESLLMQKALLAQSAPEERAARQVRTLAEPSKAEMEMADIYYENGRLFFEKGELERAKNLWRKGLKIAPAHQQLQSSLADLLSKESLILFGKGEMESAVKQWQEASQLVPDDQKIRQYLEKARQSVEQIQSIN